MGLRMDYEHSFLTPAKSYKHLSSVGSYQIYALMIARQNHIEIGRILKRHRSSISRELDAIRTNGVIALRRLSFWPFVCKACAMPSNRVARSFSTQPTSSLGSGPIKSFPPWCRLPRNALSVYMPTKPADATFGAT